MNSKFKALTKSFGSNHLTNYIITICNESPITNHEPRIMQNKPNFLKIQMNVNPILAKDYENKSAFGLRKNKPNQSLS